MKVHKNMLGTIGNTPVVKTNRLAPARVNTCRDLLLLRLKLDTK
jgi:hypothetical protein